MSYKVTEMQKSHKTCLTNHIQSISQYVTQLVINALRGGHTHMQTDVCGQNIFKKPGCTYLQPAYQFKSLIFCNMQSHLLSMHPYVYYLIGNAIAMCSLTVIMCMYVHIYISLSMTVINGRDRPEKQWHPQLTHL